MEYGEFWILEGAVDCHVALRFVDGPRKFLEGHWNRAWHALDRTGVLDLLERLQAANAIVVLDEDDQPIVLSRDEFNREIERRRDDPQAFARRYALTPSGGARWETFAEADWDRYHSYEWDPDGDDEIDLLEIAATTPQAAQQGTPGEPS